MSSDQAWRRWGEKDPYFAVITNPKYRAGNLTDELRQELLASGASHVHSVLETCRKALNKQFTPRTALDFGCGVGRLLIPMAREIEHVVGVDISPAMLEEARRNCDAQGLSNVQLVLSDDTLSAVQGPFDLVHSFIVLQHIDVPRGRALFRRLVELLAPGGIGAIQVTYGKAYHPDTYGQPPPPPITRRFLNLGAPREKAARSGPAGDPEMLMNAYNLSELFFVIQTAGVKQLRTQFTDHGGELGVFLYFRKPVRR